MKVISVINQKGGVGKTTTALAISQYLQEINKKKVLLIDLDPQGNTTFSTNTKVQRIGALGVLLNPLTIKEEIVKGDVDVLPSTPQLANSEGLIVETGKEFRLKEALEQVQNDYEYCVIDTPPYLSILTVNALTTSNYTIIPTQADIYSLQGIAQLNNTIESVRKYCNNPSLKVLGILLTRYNERQTLSKEVAKTLEKTAQQLNTKLFNSKIRECVAIKEAELNQESIYKNNQNSNASKDYTNFIQEMLKEMED